MKHIFSLLLPLLALAICGCGTLGDAICGPPGGSPYYRGVRMDLMAVSDGGALTLMAADIPFSAVADTVLVPFVAYEEWNKPRQPISEAVEEPCCNRENGPAPLATTANTQ